MKKFNILFVAVAGLLLFSGTRAEAQYWYRPGYHPGYYRPVVVAPVPVYPVYSYSVAYDVQTALRRRGYYHGPIDGILGPSSRAAIRRWQYDHRLAVTGGINRPLLRSLGL